MGKELLLSLSDLESWSLSSLLGDQNCGEKRRNLCELQHTRQDCICIEGVRNKTSLCKCVVK